MKQWTIEELKALKKELKALNDLNSIYYGVTGIGIGDNCIHVYIQKEEYRQYIAPFYKGCVVIPIVTGEILPLDSR